MKSVSGKAFCRLLERRGWVLLRINGSHHIYGKTGELARLTVPVHRNDSLKLGLQAQLMKLASIGEEEL